MTASPWTPEVTANAAKLWADGVPVSKIGRLVGVSANAVHNKAHREGWPARENPVKYNGRSNKREAPIRWAVRAEAIRLPELMSVEAVAPELIAQPIPRPRSCQWPMWGDSKPAHVYCDGVLRAGSPYCEGHCRVAYMGAGV